MLTQKNKGAKGVTKGKREKKRWRRKDGHKERGWGGSFNIDWKRVH